MSLLFSVVYAAHANGTHHKLALDALRSLEGTDAEGWRRLFLKHATLYLEGSKAPDKEFKDFRNHVLHVRDGYWGGAPERAEAWYGRTVSALKRGDWSEAVYAAGILSHYYTDPIHPFHTAQSAAENDIHRAVEWSISKSYGDLRREGLARCAGERIALPEGSAWLRDFVCRGAERANAAYELLIAHYDFTRGVVDPPSGLDKTGREAVGRLLVYAAESFALVLGRAVAEAGVSPPAVTLSLETVLAGLAVPLKWVTNRMENAALRREVEAMYDELMSMGRVDATLSEDDRTVRDLHAREVVLPCAARQKEARERRVAATLEADPPPLAMRQARPARAPAALAGSAPAPVSAPASLPLERPLKAPTHESSAQRTYLASGDDVEAAPSIGPRTAERLKALGIATVADLLDAEAAVLAGGLADRRISEGTVRDWQDQARLVLSVPGLRGGGAQLLVGAGFRTADALAAADAALLSAAVLAFATSAEGERILRSGEPPDLEKIRGWIEIAARTLAA